MNFQFFIVVNPGFESLAFYELIRTLKRLQQAHPALSLREAPYEIHSGGVEITLPQEVGLSLNRHLRIPTRILMRLGKKTDLLLYQDFQKWLRTLKLDQFFPLKQIYVSTRSSKLKMKDKLKKVFKNTYPFQPSETGSDLYIRFFRDECTVSLDTSGEDLYVRGLQKWVGEAPLRDTMAAALLQLSLQGVEDLSNWQVVDPMMGSGTFLTEAAQFRQPLTRPFAFQNWWRSNGLDIAEDSLKTSVAALWGADQLAQNLELAEKNLQGFKGLHIDLKSEDLFAGAFVSSPYQRLVILNPPYGKRLKIQDDFFFDKVLKRIVQKFNPERLGFLVPRGARFQKPEGYEQVRYLEFSNNSVDVRFHLYLKSSQA